jgi:maleylacetoacetate isomerase
MAAASWAEMARKLYSYWRSQAAYRVRIALHVKGLAAEVVDLDLLRGDQFAPTYRALNPEMVVPTLLDEDGPPLVQSLAILEYLDERYPRPALLPEKLWERAYVRALAQTVATDAHPFIVPRVRKYLERDIGLDEEMRTAWVCHWLDEGSRVLEAQLAESGRSGKFCCGDAVSIADICLVAHFASAKLFGAREVDHYPHAQAIFETCSAMEAFAVTHPLRQAGAQATAMV